MSQENNESGEPKPFPFFCVTGGIAILRETKEQEPPVQEVSRATAVLNEEVLSLSHQNAQLGQELDRFRRLVREQAELILDLRTRNQKLQEVVDSAKSLLDAFYSRDEGREIRITNALSECNHKITRLFPESK